MTTWIKWKTTTKRKKWKTTYTNGRRPQKIRLKKWKMTLTTKWKTTSNKIKDGRQTQAQLNESTLIDCDIIVN
jgi:hypothetical protein